MKKLDFHTYIPSD